MLPILLSSNELNALLDDFSKKNDASKKTIDANKGHLILYTREKIERMNAKTLKDILKTTPVITYNENRYAVPDPLTSMSPSPFSSNFIRIYIDGIEVTHGWFGGGLSMYGDMNIDFADHIEFYYGTPSFENSPEPAYMSIFIYSKDPSRDSGGKTNLLYGSNGYNAQGFSYGEEKKDFSYMLNISRTDARGEKIPNDSPIPLSRDYKRTQIFGYIKNENQIAHLQIITKDADSLAGMSWDATPELSEVDYSSIHFDYKIDISKQWHAQVAYNRTKLDIRQRDNMPLMFAPLGQTSLNTSMESSSLTAELSYQNSFGDHEIAAGAKVRKKELVSHKISGIDVPLPAFDTEVVSSLFLQDQYNLSDNHLLSLGLSYSYINRNGDIPSDDLWQFRVGYIYANEHWSYKTYIYNIMLAKDPASLTLAAPGSKPLVQTSIGHTHEISYRNDKHSTRLILMGMRAKNEIITEELLKIDPNLETDYLSAILNYRYSFDSDNTINFQLHYADAKNSIYEFKSWGGTAMLSNSYKQFEFFNSVIWNWNDNDDKHYFDLTSSMVWNINKDLSVTLKGENLLNKGTKTDIFRLDLLTGVPMMPLSIPTSDRRITLEVEFRF